MVDLWGRRWTRDELLARVGRQEQLAGVQLVEAGDSAERGVQLVEAGDGAERGVQLVEAGDSAERGVQLVEAGDGAERGVRLLLFRSSSATRAPAPTLSTCSRPGRPHLPRVPS